MQPPARNLSPRCDAEKRRVRFCRREMKGKVSLKRAFMPFTLTEVVAASVSALAGGGSVLQMVQKLAVVASRTRRHRLVARSKRA